MKDPLPWGLSQRLKDPRGRKDSGTKNMTLNPTEEGCAEHLSGARKCRYVLSVGPRKGGLPERGFLD